MIADAAGYVAPESDFYIMDFDLVEMTEKYFRIQINFAKPDAISQNIVQPDLLEIELKLGDIFIDAQDF